MAILFAEYDLVAGSSLFDRQYYLRTNPEVARLNTDPVLHYLENGCLERREPGPEFDTSHYLEQCRKLGENLPANALLHFLTIGSKRGLTPNSGASASMLNIDVPRITNGVADAPIRGGLSIAGWAMATRGARAIEIAVDGQRILDARLGLHRPDVAAAHPTWAGARQSGFAAHLPPKAVCAGEHRVSVSVRDDREVVATADFSVHMSPIDDIEGPWNLRRKISEGEIDLALRALERLGWRPEFSILMKLQSEADLVPLSRTLDTLRRQKYESWCLRLLPKSRQLVKALAAALRGRPDYLLLAKKIIVDDSACVPSGKNRGSSRLARRRTFVMCLAPGDELGCDALLEFALTSGRHRDADIVYADDRRLSPVDSREDGYFKPAWSPDLLLSTNYLGRAWIAHSDLITRAGLNLSTLAFATDMDRVLRLTEVARKVQHAAGLLCRTGSAHDTEDEEKAAIAAALQRRKIAADVQKGCLPGHYRIARHLGSHERVSIIIPTRAAHGHIRECIGTLRALTAYSDYEIICVQNIPSEDRATREWVEKHADRVLAGEEPFNWAAFNNSAVRRATGKYLVFLNDDTEIIDPHWLQSLIEQVQRPEVGVAGPLLLYPDRSIQQAGMILGANGVGLHAFRHVGQGDPGYFGLALTQRNVIAVTGACLATRREVFDALGGFDESHGIINNDLDYCLRSHERGLLNVYTPHATLVHHELASRGALKESYDEERFRKRWRHRLALGDPYLNPQLARDQEILTVEREPAETICARHPLFSRSSVRRILVVKLDHIGDCITALPAVRRLKALFPEASLSVLVGRATLPIWRAEPRVDEIIEFNLFHARSGLGKIDISDTDLEALGQRLQVGAFELAVDLRKQPDARHVLQHSGAEYLVGFDHQGRFPWLDIALEWDEDVPLRSKRGHVSDDLLALVECIAIRTTPTGDLPARSARAPVMSRFTKLRSRPFICVHPAAGSAMRQWPVTHFASLVDLLMHGDQFNLALIGGAEDSAIAQQILDTTTQGRKIFNLVGKLSLTELPNLLKQATLFVGNNSGPHHLAASLGVPTVGVHSGVVDAVEWGPLGSQSVAVRRRMTCSPCFIEHPADCQRGLACLTQLMASDVYAACSRVLARRLDS